MNYGLDTSDQRSAGYRYAHRCCVLCGGHSVSFELSNWLPCHTSVLRRNELSDGDHINGLPSHRPVILRSLRAICQCISTDVVIRSRSWSALFHSIVISKSRLAQVST